MRARSAAALALLALAPLAACGSVKEAVGQPAMTPIAYPVPQAPVRPPMLESRDDSPRPGGANSLWRNGARSFFHDQRASRVGDILTVDIDITDKAQLQNTTTANRKATTDVGAGNLLGLTTPLARILPKSFDPSHMVGTNSDLESTGTGSVQRSEAVSLTIAAIVTSVLPNGNLAIQGRQEVRVNNELRELTIAGIVRPEDITSANTIKHTQIAEARVSYGGKGQVTAVQKVPAGQALLNSYSPF
ncbi:MAG: flagellar basal body L-ring protein FlgH [Caulobacteraceae bacterium]|nr:flagellar basal body L-ring protein FlgH [Caulobacter sp.]